MTCAQPISSPAWAAESSPTSSLATSQCSPSNKTSTVAECCGPGSPKDGFQTTCMSTAAISRNLISGHGPERWIASQRGHLARIFRLLEAARASRASVPALSGKCSEQSMLFPQVASSSKTRRKLSKRVDATLSGLSWREDIPGKMERLPLLMSARLISEIAGGCLLPTLTVNGNWNRKGASKTSGDGLATALQKLPALFATDYESPYSEAGYQRQAQQRSKPLRDTLAATTGHLLTPEFAEWFMGMPIIWSAVPKEEE